MPRTEDDRFHGYLAFQSRGVVTFPADLRNKLKADVPGVQLEVTELEEGVFILRPVLPVPADQQWFWTERWQSMEREADADIAAGRTTRFDNAKDFLSALDA
jgi:antitoxin MazE